MQAWAEVKLPPLFGSNMVMQRDVRAPIWGTADPGETVTLTIGPRKVVVRAGDTGAWQARIGPFPAGGPHTIKIAGAAGSVTFTNVMFGEVWVASGQSNMEWPVAATRNADYEIKNSANPAIRLFGVTKAVKAEPTKELAGAWAECSPQSVGGFSAVAYFFGRALYRRLQMPIGLIQTAWGGTPAESWTALKHMEGDPDLTPMLSRIPPPGQTTKPGDPSKPAWDAWTPTGLYNGMIAPLVPYAIAGAIWYQGESNASRAYQYRKLFPAMIQCWRDAWGQGDFPFIWVQLANFMKRQADPGDSAWAELREAQTMTLSMPNTGQALAIDIGEADDIHPRNKQDVGVRLCLQAQHIRYGDKDTVASGPTYKSLSVSGSKATVVFTNIGGGLIARDGLPLAGFAVAGADRKFHWAQARISGSTVVVSSPEVEVPVAVRYGWADNPNCTLYNAAGLPAV
ncbi:MAG: sialate O-acetylesterase, partial [Armatimonadetes bacterium]|nr:sialate O-acetylesterase [Armatimonadota bacterium]